nr:immunoglobulin light chain junction region [Macaca mulatta]
LLQTLEFPWTF